MRKIGGHVSAAGGLINAVKNTSDIGGNCLQIFAGSPRSWHRRPYTPAEVTPFRRAIEENGFDPVFIHALYLVNLASPNPVTLKNSVETLIADLKNGLRIGAAGVIVHIGSHLGAGFDSVSEDLIKTINDILTLTQETPILLENSAGQKGKIGTLEELGFIISELPDPRLKICLDTAHLFEAGFDFSTSEGLDRLTNDLKSHRLTERLTCLHLNDSATELDSRHDVHANLGEGKIGLAGLKDIVNHPFFSSLPLILEVPGENKRGPNKENIDRAKAISGQ